MRHEKIFKRDNGVKVSVRVKFLCQLFSEQHRWEVRVYVCGKGKRTWLPLFSEEDYWFRKLSAEEKEKAHINSALQVATTQEIEATALELWQRLSPVGEFCIKEASE